MNGILNFCCFSSICFVRPQSDFKIGICINIILPIVALCCLTIWLVWNRFVFVKLETSMSLWTAVVRTHAKQQQYSHSLFDYICICTREFHRLCYNCQLAWANKEKLIIKQNNSTGQLNGTLPIYLNFITETFFGFPNANH